MTIKKTKTETPLSLVTALPQAPESGGAQEKKKKACVCVHVCCVCMCACAGVRVHTRL